MESKFKKQLREIIDNPAFSESFVFEKISELLANNAQFLTQNLKEPSTLNSLLNYSISFLKSETKDYDYKSNISSLDAITGGFGMGEFVIIGARPGMGKSLFLQYLMLQGARKFPVLYFTLDSGKDELILRLISSLTEIEHSFIKKRIISNEQWELIERVKKDIENLPIYISDDVPPSMQMFKALCKRYIEENGVKVIYIDFLQLMGSLRYRNQRELELSYISRELKSLARENNVCIIATSQLSRSCETRGGAKYPVLSDLRESGSFEQDADKVLFLYRAEYYGFNEDENGNSMKNIMEIDVAKNRNGFVGRAKVKHNLPFGGILPYVPFEAEMKFNPNRIREIDDSDALF
jgi:replicative DNA helicase